MGINREALKYSANHNGLVTDRVLRDTIGLSYSARRHLEASGVLERLGKDALRVTGSPETAHQLAHAAVLERGPDARLSHRSACALWGLPGFQLEPFDVTANRQSHPRDSPIEARTHQPRLLLSSHTTVLRGIPVTTPSRTIVDLASLPRVRPAFIERTLDNTLARRLATVRSMQRVFSVIGRKGRAGTRLMRALLADRAANYLPPESGLEARFQRLIRGACLPEFERQIDVGDDDWLGRVDFVNRQLRIVVQIDSALYHSALIDQRRDAEQTRRLRAAGWIVCRFTDIDVWHRPEELLANLREAVAAARHFSAA